eukprot:Skav208102  [mRNA]  locus=scaffold1681:261214:262527:- [translate_table: standard]
MWVVYGRVCQLCYEGGGRLFSENLRGEPSIFPFEKGPCGLTLQIGQIVRFCVSHRFGYDEAVDLQIVHDDRALGKGPEWNPQTLDPEVCHGVKQLSQQHLIKLQRNIGIFNNATMTERSELVKKAEEKLAELLAEDPWDGNKIAKLVRRCSGWLCPPVVSANLVSPLELSHPTLDGDSVGEQKCLQRRLRKLLIEALQVLDLEDACTVEALLAAIIHVKALIERNETAACASTSAGRQWQKLQALVALEASSSKIRTDGIPDHSLPKQSEAKPASHKGENRPSDQSTISHGRYCPNEKVRSVSSVFRDQACRIKCSQCPLTIFSTWFWKHPSKRTVHVLVPLNGHRPCSAKLGHRCGWHALDGTPTKADDMYHLDFCQHHRRRASCRQCGGREICEHNRLRHRCKMCKSQSGPKTIAGRNEKEIGSIADAKVWQCEK